MTLYTQVASNRAKTIFYLLVYVSLLLLVGLAASWYFDSYSILFLAGIISIVQGFVSYWFSDKVALAVSQAKPMERNQYPEVHKLMENLVITAGLPMPKLYLIDDSAMNAFATGRDARHAAIAVTTGLIERLDKNELEGVLAHELSHVGNEDIRLMSMVMVMAGLIALISDIITRTMFWGGGRHRDDNEGNSSNGIFLLIGLALAILAPIAATLIQLAISRKREFLADANAVLLTRYPEGMINALQKIGGDEEPLEAANKATAHMYFSSPLYPGAVANLFSTHPPIEQRIEALQKGTGLHPHHK